MEENKMDDMRMVKFESLIEDINENLYFHRSNDGNKNASLSIVFDYEKCNNFVFATIIILVRFLIGIKIFRHNHILIIQKIKLMLQK